MTTMAPLPQAQRIDLVFDTLTDFTSSWLFSINGLAVDLTLFTFVSQIRPATDDDTLLLDMGAMIQTIADDNTLAVGEFRLSVSAEDIRSMHVEEASYDLAIVSETHGNYKLMFGHVTVQQSVTEVSS